MAAGFSVRAAFTREASTETWPSPDPAAQTSLLPILSESVANVIEQFGITTIDSLSYTRAPRITGVNVAGDLSLEVQYKGLEFFLTTAMGFEVPTGPVSLGGGAYRHVIEVDRLLGARGWAANEGWIANAGLIANDQKMRRGTYTVDKGTTYWEAISCVLQGFDFLANPGGCQITTALLGDTLRFSSTSDLTALSCPKEQVIFQDGTFYLSETAPLTSLNVIDDLVGISVRLDNNLSTRRTIHTRTGISEPKREGPAIVSGTFAIPTYLSIGAILQDWTSLGTDLYGMLEFVGREILSSGQFYTLRFWFPSLRLTSFDIPVQGPQQIPQNYQFVCSPRASNPSGFPTNVKLGPLIIELINDQSAHPLL